MPIIYKNRCRGPTVFQVAGHKQPYSFQLIQSPSSQLILHYSQTGVFTAAKISRPHRLVSCRCTKTELTALRQ